MAAHPLQAAEDVREVAAKDSAIRVQLIDDHVAEVLEQLRPPGVVRQDPRMEHVGIAQHHVRLAADRATCVRGRVAVVSEDPDLDVAAVPDDLCQRVQFGELVLRERFGWEEIQRARRRVLQDRVQDRRVVAERFPRSRRRDGDDVAAGEHMGEGFALVRVELVDAALRERRFEPFVGAVRVGSK